MGPLAWFVQGVQVPAQKFAKRRLIDESPSQPPCDGDRSTTYHIAAAHATCAAIQGEKKRAKQGTSSAGSEDSCRDGAILFIRAPSAEKRRFLWNRKRTSRALVNTVSREQGDPMGVEQL